MEPWDGPASIAFTDGRRIGAVLDRNGLRPSRYLVTKDGMVVMASEAGVLDIPPEQVERKGRLQPGRMFFIDTVEGRIVEDEEIKATMAARKPYRQWLDENLVRSRPASRAAERAADLRLRGRRPAQATAGLRLHDRRAEDDPGADGGQRAGAGGLDGHRHAAGGAVGQVAAAVQLLQAAIRPGHQSADRSDPRGDGDLRDHHDRLGAEPVRGDAASTAASSSCGVRC